MKALPAVALAVNLASIDASADGVGFRDILVEVDGERLTTALWYPTDEPSGRMTLGTFSMAANHRAAGHGGERCSVGFFLEPDFETTVVAPAGGPPVSYAQHLVNVFPDRFEAPRAA